MADNPPVLAATPPPLTEIARNQLRSLRDRYEKNLEGIAERIALSSNAENVLAQHVDEAHLTLKRCGLSPPGPKPKFYQRDDVKVGVGTLLAGASFSISSFAKDVIQAGGSLNEHPYAFWLSMIIIPMLMGIGGIALAVWGWVEGSHSQR